MATQIRLLGPGDHVDVISGSHEDTFTLETFEDLVDEHAQQGTRLIIARVKTREKVNVDTAFYSFYVASYLNKTLFRVRDKELIHRYHPMLPISAINPLTNSEILGEVCYYMVRVPPKDKTAKQMPVLKTLVHHEPSIPEEQAVDLATTTRLESPRSPPATGPGGDAQKRRESQTLLPGQAPVGSRRNTMASEVVRRASAAARRSSTISSILSGGRGKRDSIASSASTSSHRCVNNHVVPVPRRQSAAIPQSMQVQGEVKRVLVADFIGTDYNFVHSEKLRSLFAANVLEKTELELPEFEEGELFREAVSEDEILSLLGRLTRRMELGPEEDDDEIKVQFSVSSIFGMAISVYLALCFAVFSISMSVLLDDGGDQSITPPWYWTMVPFASFIVDRLIMRVYNEDDERGALAPKLFVYTAYILVPIFLYPSTTVEYAIARNVANVIGSLFCLCFTFGYFVMLSTQKVLY